MSEIQFQKTFYGIAASLVEGDKVTSGIGRTYSEAEEALREKISNRSEPSPEPEAAPASEAQGAAAASQRALDDAAWMIISRERHLDTARSLVLANAELAQLRARVAILDAQEVELPESPTAFFAENYERCVEAEEPEGSSWPCLFMDAVEVIQKMEGQLLDARRAVQAWREASSTYRTEHRRAAENNFRRDCGCRRCKAHDALAGKGE